MIERATNKEVKFSEVYGGIVVDGKNFFKISKAGMTRNSAVLHNRLDAPMLVETPAKIMKVAVDHKDLSNLIGELCGAFDLVSDKEQRTAIKRTIKGISRGWLNEIYAEAGYEEGMSDGTEE